MTMSKISIDIPELASLRCESPTLARSETGQSVSHQVLANPPFKFRRNVNHFGTSLCRGVRAAHFKSAVYICGFGFTILGIIAWIFQ